MVKPWLCIDFEDLLENLECVHEARTGHERLTTTSHYRTTSRRTTGKIVLYITRCPTNRSHTINPPPWEEPRIEMIQSPTGNPQKASCWWKHISGFVMGSGYFQHPIKFSNIFARIYYGLLQTDRTSITVEAVGKEEQRSTLVCIAEIMQVITALLLHVLNLQYHAKKKKLSCFLSLFSPQKGGGGIKRCAAAIFPRMGMQLR